LKLLALTQGYFTKIDDSDYPFLSQFKWTVRIIYRADGTIRNVYAYRNVHGIKGKRRPTSLYLHRFLLNTPTGKEVDHENHDGLDNRKDNLRFATKSQNQGNRTPRHGKSGFRGVWPNRNQWVAMIGSGSSRKYLGIFDSLKDAAKAYNEAAVRKFGHFAVLNKVEAE
jgi:hypothetical protein